MRFGLKVGSAVALVNGFLADSISGLARPDFEQSDWPVQIVIVQDQMPKSS